MLMSFGVIEAVDLLGLRAAPVAARGTLAAAASWTNKVRTRSGSMLKAAVEEVRRERGEG